MFVTPKTIFEIDSKNWVKITLKYNKFRITRSNKSKNYLKYWSNRFKCVRKLRKFEQIVFLNRGGGDL